jgi:hypothetical protein
MRIRLTIAGYLLLGWPAPGFAQTPRAAARFTDSVLVDFTGDGSPEVWKVEAMPRRPDSLRLTMFVVRAGRSLYGESWVVAGSSDSVHVRRVLKEALDRHRLYPLDSKPEKPWSVDVPWFELARQTLVEQEGMDSSAATAVIAELTRTPRTALQTPVGRDASVFRAWSDRAGRFVVIGRCC